MKTILMSSAALLLIVTAPAFAGPVFTGKSTRAEIEATRQLNLQASQAAAPSQPAQAAPTSEVVAMNAPPSAAPTTKVETASMDGAASTLSSISNPPTKIATASVLDSSGKIVGAVQKVEVTPQGQPTKVAVALIGKDEQMIVLDASAVRYDPAKNQIMAQATADQMRAMPDKS